MIVKGLFRLWCVLTAVWVALIAVLPEYREGALPMMIVPPLVILAIGSGLVWAARGFRA